jgi:hypothetical protein
MVLDVQQPRDANSRTITEAGVLKQKIYSDTTYDYVCKSIPGTALATASWQVKRIDSDGSIEFADGNEHFDNVATSLAIVAALSYS